MIYSKEMFFLRNYIMGATAIKLVLGYVTGKAFFFGR